MLWIKSLHIIFVVAWFAGLFYLPRIYVNLAMVNPESKAEYARLLLMASKLYRFTTILAIPALFFGFWLLTLSFQGGWLHAKLLVVLLTCIYHITLYYPLRRFRHKSNQHSHLWFRWFNEIPVVLLSVIVILVVVKPF